VFWRLISFGLRSAAFGMQNLVVNMNKQELIIDIQHEYRQIMGSLYLGMKQKWDENTTNTKKSNIYMEGSG
jgi:hypothetical protein